MIAREGERVTPEQIAKLRALRELGSDFSTLRTGAGMLLVTLLLVFVTHRFAKLQYPQVPSRDPRPGFSGYRLHRPVRADQTGDFHLHRPGERLSLYRFGELLLPLPLRRRGNAGAHRPQLGGGADLRSALHHPARGAVRQQPVHHPLCHGRQPGRSALGPAVQGADEPLPGRDPGRPGQCADDSRPASAGRPRLRHSGPLQGRLRPLWRVPLCGHRDRPDPVGGTPLQVHHRYQAAGTGQHEHAGAARADGPGARVPTTTRSSSATWSRRPPRRSAPILCWPG